jgi:peptidoglycan/xylan/chitin deacetylase (PgdA/CDA1 family)
MARLALVGTILILVTIPVGLLAHFYLPPFLTEEMPRPELPRLEPFTPPLEGGPEGENRGVQPPIPLPDGVVTRLDTAEPVVALTFDDGPDPLFTPRLLEILRGEGVAATFFVIANRAAARPDLVRQMLADGHEVGNHTLSHARLTDLPELVVRHEILEAQRVLETITGERARLFRPPYGRINEAIFRMAKEEAGLTTVMWSVDSRDWEGISAREIREKVLANLAPGSIILMHCAGGVSEGFTSTLEALPSILEALRSRGYRPVTLGNALGE